MKNRKQMEKKGTIGNVQELLNHAKNLQFSGQHKQAIEVLASLVEKNILEPEIYLVSAKSKEALGQIREARYTLALGGLLFPLDKRIRDSIGDYIRDLNGRFTELIFNQTSRPTSCPTISLVMIVKNEEKDLPKCLDSFRDIVQEMIVVDTGSTDRTVEIARSYGARVEFYEWIDDFAAARNESLKYATCDWILRVDADEFIEESEKPKLLHAVASGKAEIYLCKTYHPDQPDKAEMTNIRMFKNHLGILFENPIHEGITQSAIKLRLLQATINLRIMHTGYHDDIDSVKNKFNRNLQVCDRYLLDHPDNYFTKLVRATSIFENLPNRGIPEMEEAIDTLPETAASINYLVKAYVYLGVTYAKNKDKEKISGLIRNILIDFQANRRVMQFAGELALFELGLPEFANRIFGFAHSIADNDTVEQILIAAHYNLHRIRELLVETSVLIGDYQQARHYMKLLEKEDDYRQVVSAQNLNKAAIAYSSANYEEVIAILKNVVLIPAEHRQMLISSLMNSGLWKECCKEVVFHAARNEIKPQEYLDLAFVHLQLNREEYARNLVRWGNELGSDPAGSYYVDALISVKESRYEEALESMIQAFILDAANKKYQDNLQYISSILNLSPLQALKQTGLKWLDHHEMKNKGIFALIAYSRFQPEDQEVQQVINHVMNS